MLACVVSQSVAEYGRDLWRGFTQLVVLSYKLQRQSILLPVVLELPLPKVVELIQVSVVIRTRRRA